VEPVTAQGGEASASSPTYSLRYIGELERERDTQRRLIESAFASMTGIVDLVQRKNFTSAVATLFGLRERLNAHLNPPTTPATTEACHIIRATE
jgi:hypothetical protein